jgi:hypothetical protein
MKKPKPEIINPQTDHIKGDVKPPRYEAPVQRPKPTPKPPKKK